MSAGLERDEYVRKIDGYLPTAEVAFIDEIFKANSAILNALLTLLNERLFDNGNKRSPVPLLCMVRARCMHTTSQCHTRVAIPKGVLPGQHMRQTADEHNCKPCRLAGPALHLVSLRYNQITIVSAGGRLKRAAGE